MPDFQGRGWEALRIVQLATRYSKMPDQVIYAGEAGWGYEARFSFNDAVTSYVEQFERMRDATIEKSEPRPHSKPKYTKRVPKYSESELLQFLGIDPEDVAAKRVLEQAVPESAWEALDDGDWLSKSEA